MYNSFRPDRIRSWHTSDQEFENTPGNQSGGTSPWGGEVIMLSKETPEYETPPVPTSLRMRKEPAPVPVRARILWPALGFPAVITPSEKPVESQVSSSDATHCICVLLLSNRKSLSKEEASRYLRYVPWEQRGRRHIPVGQQGFIPEEDLYVINDEPDPAIRKSKERLLARCDIKDNFGSISASGTAIFFGGGRETGNYITVKLSDSVRDFYKTAGLLYLHEIRVSERFSAQLKEGHYHLFWNNETPNENVPSAEMQCLLDRFAAPRRKALGPSWQNWNKYFMQEYEYEQGSFQKNYKDRTGGKLVRTEILHPLFVNRTPSNNLRIGHLTDLHVDTRSNVYEERFKNLPQLKGKIDFNNWNRDFEIGYDKAKKDTDILLLTGDLIDYGRGHVGLNAADKLGDNKYYHADRNWFLFYYLLASGNAYQKPVYTILGNHDWRINPYPPFAPSSPGFNAFVHNHTNFPNAKDRKSFLEAIHGPGHERTFSYEMNAKGVGGMIWQAVKRTFTTAKFWDHLPVKTTIDSVKWYLLSINPFLDYSCSLPSGQKLLMLDWAEEEKLFFGEIVDGKEYLTLDIDKVGMPGPQANKSLTGLQKRLIEEFVSQPGNAKIIGMHPPPLGPYPEWSDEDLLTGRKTYGPNEKARGPRTYATKLPNGKIEPWNGHPIFATLPVNDHNHEGTIADYGSFQKHREWFIKKMAAGGTGVRLIFSGHIHRNGLFAVNSFSEREMVGPAIAGKLLVQSLYKTVSPVSFRGMKFRYPLFVNTTSLGPRGGFYKRKKTETETKNGDLSIMPGFAKVDLSNKGEIGRVHFESVS